MDRYQKTEEAAKRLGALIADHKGGDVMVLDVRERNSWADFFVIATVSSSTHSRGLLRHVQESLKELDLAVRPTRRKSPDGEDWTLIDLGDIVVHLMTAPARSFYDLEKLWFGAPDLMREGK